MADGGQLLIFRAFTTEELLVWREKLKAQFLAMGPYASQTVGAKSWTKDTRALNAQMEAIQFVLNERSCPYEPFMITDFSQGGSAGQPAGTFDQLSY